MRKFRKKLSAAFLSLSIASVSAVTFTAYADVYNYDRRGSAVPSQAGYTAEKAVSGTDLGISAFNSPSDIFCSSDNIFYIADSGNDRIIAVDTEFEKVLEVYDSFIMPDGTETALKKPMGVCVSAENGLMYIADTDNGRILVADMDRNVKYEITKPETDVYDSKKTFLPQKVLVDKGGNIYAVLGNITTGAAMFSPEGEFTGFYGANRVEPTAEAVRNYFRGLFMSDEKKARRARSVPSGITNFDIDGDFIFTCTSSSGQTADTVKKLNAAGINIFSDMKVTFGDYTPMYDTSQNKVMSSAFVDIDISENGNINCLDYTAGRIFQYDKDGDLLFIAGESSQRLGGFDKSAAIESMGDRLFVVDSAKCTVTVFRETLFGNTVHKAVDLYNEGRYDEALEPWYEVLKRDGNYHFAHVGIASALLRKGDYKGAMKYAKLAGDKKIYGKAFEGYRREFLGEYGGYIFAGAAVLAVAAVILRKRRKSGRKEKKAHDGLK